MDPYFATFDKACRAAFQFLVSEFGFEDAQTEQFGYECYVTFDRGPQTVSIMFGDGGLPIVELALPSSEADEPPEEYLTKDGVARSRRIPHLPVVGKYDPENPIDLTDYLERTAGVFRNLEGAFLTGGN